MQVNVNFEIEATTAKTIYVPLYRSGYVRKAQVVCNANESDGTVTVSSGSTSLASGDLSATAGTVVTMTVADDAASTAVSVLKIAVDNAASAAGNVGVMVEVDEFQSAS